MDKRLEADAARGARPPRAREQGHGREADRVAAHGTAPLASPTSKAMKSVSLTPRATADAPPPPPETLSQQQCSTPRARDATCVIA